MLSGVLAFVWTLVGSTCRSLLSRQVDSRVSEGCLSLVKRGSNPTVKEGSYLSSRSTRRASLTVGLLPLCLQGAA